MEKGLRFEENSGKIEFLYTTKVDKRNYDHVSGEIPERVVKRGKEAIRNYAQKKVDQFKKKWKRANKIEEDIRKNHIPIQTNYKNETFLEGRIVEATDKFIRVELDGPLQGQGSINFGFASAIVGRYVFDENHKISHHGYDAAYRALRSAYEDAIHKPQKELVRKLNSCN